MLYPSDLAIQAANLSPASGIPIEEPSVCACCGKPLNPDNEYIQWDIPPSFLDIPMLKKNTGHLCPACSTVLQSDFTMKMKLSKTVITNDGVYAATSNNDRAYWLLHPPQPPFLFIASSAKKQHLVWKSPVNLDRDRYFIQFGNKQFFIRRKTLEKARLSNEKITNAYAVYQKEKNGRKVNLKSVFAELEREGKSTRHGMINTNIRDFISEKDDPELSEGLSSIERLTEGERWAFGVIIKAKDIETKPGFLIKREV